MFGAGFRDHLRSVAASLRGHQDTKTAPDDLIRQGLEDHIEDAFEKVAGYGAGNTLQPRASHEPPLYFSVNSLGNWLHLASSLGIQAIRAEHAGDLSAVDMLNLQRCLSEILKAGEEPDDAGRASLQKFAALHQEISRRDSSSMLRFDMAAPSSIKQKATFGLASEKMKMPEEAGGPPRPASNQELNLPAGVSVMDMNDIRKDPSVNKAGASILESIFGSGLVFLPEIDERIMNHALSAASPIDHPLWVRPWITPKTWSGTSPHGLVKGQDYPREWRIYILNGELKAVSNYYVQATARMDTPEDIERLGFMIFQAGAMAGYLRAGKLVPHAVQYERHPMIEDDKPSFSFDFMETEAGPLLIEAGPAHLRNPDWGAHPCCFGASREPEGIALSVSEPPLPLPDYLREAYQLGVEYGGQKLAEAITENSDGAENAASGMKP